MVLVIVFSFYTYSGDDGPGEATGEETTSMESTDDSENESTKELNPEFKDKLKEHFGRFIRATYGLELYAFDEEQDASQSFNKECPNQYGEFQQQLTNLFKDYEGSSDEFAEIKRLKEGCKEVIVSNYGLLYQDIERKLHSLKMDPSLKNNLEQIISVFYNIPNTFNGADDLKKFFVDLRSFKNCITTFFEQDLYGNYHLNKPLEDILKHSHNNKCHEVMEKVKTFIKGEIFQHLVNLPSLCQSKGGCVAELRKFVGLDPQFVSLFQSCSEKREKTEVCCDSLENCEDPEAKQAVQSNKSSIQSLINSGDENVCSSNNSGLKEIDKNLFDNTRKTCENLTTTCLNECEEDFKNFKSEFKNCFLVPGFGSKDKDFDLHDNNACKRQIDEIKAGYETNNAITTNKKQFKFLSNENEIKNEIKNYCDVPLNEYNKKSIEMRDKTRGIVQGWCSELLTEKNEKDGSENQTDNTFPTFNPRIPTIRSPSSSPRRGGPESSYSPSSGFNMGNNNGGGSNVGNNNGSTDGTSENSDDTVASAGNFERTPDKSSTDEEEDSFEEDAAADCLGVCNVPEGKDEQYPAWKKYHESMAKDSDLEGLSDEVNETLKAEREARERSLAGRGGSASGGFLEGLQDRASSAFSGFARAAKKPLKKAYKAAFGGPKSPPPKLKDVLGIHGSNVDLMQRQRELHYMFCNTHNCGITREELDQLKKEANK